MIRAILQALIASKKARLNSMNILRHGTFEGFQYEQSLIQAEIDSLEISLALYPEDK